MRDFEPYTYDYWNNYHERLIKYISHFKKINDDKPKYLYKTDDELLNFNYEFEFFNEKLARLYAELQRVKILLSVLKHKTDTDEI
tara:strand:+ start:1558 stop:1812 length:255 start_codon:yes stop_codon:yes gene_type:complete